MPPKRSAAAAAVTGGETVAPNPSPKRIKVSTESKGGKQRKLEAFFTSPKKPKSQRAGAGAGAAAKQLDSTNSASASASASALERLEVIVIGDEEGEHQISARLPAEGSNERRPAAGNGTDCAAGPVIVPATPMEEVRLGVRCKEENSSMEENGMDTDVLLARHLARAEGVDIDLTRKLESGFQTGINRLDRLGSPSSAYSNVRALPSPFTLLNPYFFGSLTMNAAVP